MRTLTSEAIPTAYQNMIVAVLKQSLESFLDIDSNEIVLHTVQPTEGLECLIT